MTKLTHMIYQKLLDWLQPNPTAKIMFSLSCFLSPLCRFWQSKPDNDIIELCFRNKNPKRWKKTPSYHPYPGHVRVCVCLLVPQALGFPCCKMVLYLPKPPANVRTGNLGTLAAGTLLDFLELKLHKPKKTCATVEAELMKTHILQSFFSRGCSKS